MMISTESEKEQKSIDRMKLKLNVVILWEHFTNENLLTVFRRWNFYWALKCHSAVWCGTILQKNLANKVEKNTHTHWWKMTNSSGSSCQFSYRHSHLCEFLLLIWRACANIICVYIIWLPTSSNISNKQSRAGTIYMYEQAKCRNTSLISSNSNKSK